jgi:hypothetical protein
MSSKFSARSLGLALGVACAALYGSMQVANAVPVSLDTWYTFGFSGVGTPLISGVGFGLGTNPDSVAVGDAPWTITLTGPATLTVLDLFQSVDQFEIFNNLVLLGQTSVPVPGGLCGSDITCALGDLDYSRGVFLLGAGDHSITGAQLAGIPGAGVFQITPTAVPEPASLGLLGAALIGFGLFRRRRQRA